MSFCSIDFIFLFLPLLVLLHGILKKQQNIVLIAGSILFYYFAADKNFTTVAILVVLSLVNFFNGILIDTFEDRKKRLITTWIAVIVNVVPLVFFKYWSSFAGIAFPAADFNDLILPIGISFYTFKNLSYIREVYAHDVQAERSIVRYLAYILAFPQITMGPIQTYKDFEPYLGERTVTLPQINAGLAEFIIGFGLKQIIANRLGGVWASVERYGYEGISTPLAWIGIIAFSLQIYFDFYGYSLMSEGIGAMLGYHTPRNFYFPYMSKSMSEFWRRWHITLGSWFKEVIYFPLGGSRCSKLCTARNMLIVWLLTGIWHGSTLNFLIWGLFLFAVITLERTGKIDFIIKHNVFSHIYMALLILLSWLIFKMTSIEDFGIYLSRLVPIFGSPDYVYEKDWVEVFSSLWIYMLAGLALVLPCARNLYERAKESKAGRFIIILGLMTVFWYAVYCSACGGNDPFLYNNF